MLTASGTRPAACACTPPAQIVSPQAPPPPFDLDRVQALVHRAGLASSHKDHAESARLYTQASELMGGAVNVVLEQRLGDALMHTQEYERAYRAYLRASSVPPEQAGMAPAAHALCLARGSAAAFYTHRRSKALQLLQPVLEADALGLLYAGPARAGAALAWATMAHLGGPGDPERALVDHATRQRIMAVSVRLFVSEMSLVRESVRGNQGRARHGLAMATAAHARPSSWHVPDSDAAAFDMALGQQHGCEGIDAIAWEQASSVQEALVHYGAFHAKSLRCCESTRRLQSDTPSASAAGAALRVLIYQPSEAGEGWGNRLLSLSSAFVLALTTRRVFLVNWTEPCALEELLAPPLGIDWDLTSALSRCASALGAVTGAGAPAMGGTGGVAGGTGGVAGGTGGVAGGGRGAEAAAAEMRQFSLEDVYREREMLLSRGRGPGVLFYSSLHDLFRPIKTLANFWYYRFLCLFL